MREKLVSWLNKPLRAAPSAVAHAFGAYLSVMCRPSKRTGVDVLAKAARHSLTLC